MYPVFTRRELNYDADFARWLNWPDPVQRDAYRAMACNVMYDHRVQKERANLFNEYYLAGGKLDEAIRRYFEEHVRTADPPHFVLDLNLSNIVAGAPLANFVDERTPLITFLDLNGLIEVYRWASRNPHPDYRDIFRLYDVRPGDDVSPWLRRRVDQFGERSFVGALLAALRERRKEPDSHYHPAWAALWSELAPVLSEGLVNRWWETVGVYKPGPRWIIPLRYTVYEAGTVVRPSILDSGFYAYHFPSPAGVPSREGGCCVDLQTAPPARGLIHEYIHKQIDYTEQHWLAAGGFCLQTSRGTTGNLPDQRRSHYSLLLSKYPNVLNWMPALIG